MDRKVLILNGRGLDVSSDAILEACSSLALDSGISIECRRCDEEGKLRACLENVSDNFQGLIVNPGIGSPEPGIAHAIQTIIDRGIPLVELHLENIFQSDDEASPSLTPSGQAGLICGLGLRGYSLAVRSIAASLAAACH